MTSTTLNVVLRGYPEAILATDTLTLRLEGPTTAGAVMRQLAGRSERLASALLHRDGVPRVTTKLLAAGALVGHETRVDHLRSVTVLASLPCDG